jgi:hypothetical protein
MSSLNFIKKSLLLLLFVPFITLSQLGDYYTSDTNPKAKGLNFKIKSPIGFEQSIADRPNIVQKWTKDKTDNNKIIQFGIIVKKEGFLAELKKDDFKYYLKNEEGVKDFVADIPGASNYRYFSVDNFPGFITDIETQIDRLDLSFTLYMTQITVFVGSYVFTLQLTSPVKKNRENHKSLLFQLANSIIFTDQYK